RRLLRERADRDLVEERAGDDDRVTLDRDRVRDVLARGAERLRPHDLAVRVELRDERVGLAGGLLLADRAAEIGFAFDVSADVDRAVAVDRDRLRRIDRRSAEARLPQRLAGRTTWIRGER